MGHSSSSHSYASEKKLGSQGRNRTQSHVEPTSLNRLAETLRRRGRTEEAAAVAQRVADGYARTTNVVDRYEAALAFEWLSHQKGREIDRKLAFALAKMLREAEPDNPDFRFLYARLLAESPSLESASNRTVAVKSAFVLSLSPSPPAHPCGLSQSTELSSLCYIAASH